MKAKELLNIDLEIRNNKEFIKENKLDPKRVEPISIEAHLEYKGNPKTNIVHNLDLSYSDCEWHVNIAHPSGLISSQSIDKVRMYPLELMALKKLDGFILRGLYGWHSIDEHLEPDFLRKKKYWFFKFQIVKYNNGCTTKVALERDTYLDAHNLQIIQELLNS